MMKFAKRLSSIATILFLMIFVSGCSMEPERFEGTHPRFNVEEYFVGKTRAWGLFEDRFGKVRRQFVVDIEGRLEGETLILDEKFSFSDGEKDRRVWRITRIDEHTYEGRADDVVGVASGKSYGNALNWVYTMDMKVDDGTLRVDFNDWMFLQPDGVMLNRAKVTKWGLLIGEVTLSFMRVDDNVLLEPAKGT